MGEKVKRSANPRAFLSPQERALVEEAIAEAEAGTSAQIKLIIARHCWGRIQEKAARAFAKMGLHKSAHRSGVLILLITTNREFVIYGDDGIHEKAGQAHWDGVRDRMAASFRADAFGQGISEGVRMIGAELAEHFPRRADSVNEATDEIGFQE